MNDVSDAIYTTDLIFVWFFFGFLLWTLMNILLAPTGVDHFLAVALLRSQPRRQPRRGMSVCLCDLLHDIIDAVCSLSVTRTVCRDYASYLAATAVD